MKRFFLFFILTVLISTGFLVGIFDLVLAEGQSCTDSEGGNYYYKKGVIEVCETAGEQESCSTIIDSCSGNMLTEYYCNGDQVTNKSYTCPNECRDGRCIYGSGCWSDSDCLSGEFCEFSSCGAEKGSCVTIPVNCSTIYDPSCGCDGKTYNNNCLRQKAKVDLDHAGRCGVACADSDNGRDLYTKGSIDGYNNKGEHLRKTDSCNGGTLTEYYCDNSDLVDYVERECSQGCSNGACKIVEKIVVPGCIDHQAQNYNSKATEDDGSCTYPAVVPTEKNDEEVVDDVTTQQSEQEVRTDQNFSSGVAQRFGYQVSEQEHQVVSEEQANFTGVDSDLVNRLRGRILLQVENNGQTWYVEPDSGKRFYLKNGQSAYLVLNAFGLGITNQDLAKIPVGVDSRIEITDSDGDSLSDELEKVLGTDSDKADSDGDGYTDAEEIKNNYNPLNTAKVKNKIDANLVNRLAGKILLQVQSAGQAWYVNPADGKRYYLKDGNRAYQIMKFLSLGIINDNLSKIEVGSLE